jgi:hypothetical protein
MGSRGLVSNRKSLVTNLTWYKLIEIPKRTRNLPLHVLDMSILRIGLVRTVNEEATSEGLPVIR